MVENIDKTLAERGNQYGDFYTHAKITQTLKDVFQHTRNWEDLPDDMKEALDQVASKIGRILNGNPYHYDSWHDIIGYVKLVADKLASEPETSIEQQVQMVWGTPAEMIDDE